MASPEVQFSVTLTVPFTFTDAQTVSAVTTIITNRPTFNVNITQTADPYNTGGPAVYETHVAIDAENVTTTRSTTPNTTPSQQAGSTIANGTSTSSSAATSSAPVPPPAPNNGLSSGAAAGIGIGCALAGAVIASLLVCLLMRRKQRRHTTRSLSRGPSMRQDGYSNRGNDSVGMAPLAKAMPTTTVERALEPPMQDSDILNNMQRLGTAIKNYAQSYCTTASGNLAGGASVDAERLASLLGSNAPVQPQRLATLLASAQSRTAAVRFLIAWTVVPGTGDMAAISLLPPELARSLAVIHSGRSDHHERSLMLSRWRQLTATLMRDTYDRDDIPTSDDRQHTVADLVEQLDAVLAPLSSTSRGSDADRRDSLTELVKRGARFQYMLFTQPTEWSFQWAAPGRQNSDLVVFPGLSRIADERGVRLAQPQIQVQAQGVSVDSVRPYSR